jgi:hypothetical protein
MEKLIPLKDEVRTEVSPRFSISNQQWQTIGRQVLKYFVLPVALVTMKDLYVGKGFDEAIKSAYFAGLLILINVISKFTSETK